MNTFQAIGHGDLNFFQDGSILNFDSPTVGFASPTLLATRVFSIIPSDGYISNYIAHMDNTSLTGTDSRVFQLVINKSATTFTAMCISNNNVSKDKAINSIDIYPVNSGDIGWFYTVYSGIQPGDFTSGTHSFLWCGSNAILCGGKSFAMTSVNGSTSINPVFHTVLGETGSGNLSCVSPINCTLKSFYVFTDTPTTRIAGNVTFTLYKNNVPTSLSITLSNNISSGSNISNSVSVSSLDTLFFAISAEAVNSSGVSGQFCFGIECVSQNSGETPIFTSGKTFSNTNGYIVFSPNGSSWVDGTFNIQPPVNIISASHIKFKNMYVTLDNTLGIGEVARFYNAVYTNNNITTKLDTRQLVRQNILVTLSGSDLVGYDGINVDSFTYSQNYVTMVDITGGVSTTGISFKLSMVKFGVDIERPLIFHTGSDPLIFNSGSDPMVFHSRFIEGM